MTDAPVTWLAARLNDLERIAQGAIDQGGRGRRGEGVWAEVDPDRLPGLIGDACGEVVTHERKIGGPNRWRAEHIVANDPRSVLARVEADRRILARHRTWAEEYGDQLLVPEWGNACAGCGEAGWDYGPRVEDIRKCPELRDLLSAHRFAPGFKEDWLHA